MKGVLSNVLGWMRRVWKRRSRRLTRRDKDGGGGSNNAVMPKKGMGVAPLQGGGRPGGSMFSNTYLCLCVRLRSLASCLSQHQAPSEGCHEPPAPHNSSEVDTMKVSKHAGNAHHACIADTLRSSPTHPHNTSPTSKCSTTSSR